LPIDFSICARACPFSRFYPPFCRGLSAPAAVLPTPAASFFDSAGIFRAKSMKKTEVFD